MVNTPICFEDGVVANRLYEVPVRTGGPCPKCNFPLEDTLAYNPFDTNYYLFCCACKKWFRYCDLAGRLLDLKVVHSNKKTPLDENLGLNELVGI